MSKFFRTKPRVVKALQWFPTNKLLGPYPCPDDREGFNDIRYIDPGHAYITISYGKQYKLNPGDWIIKATDRDGYEVYSNEEFSILFEPND